MCSLSLFFIIVIIIILNPSLVDNLYNKGNNIQEGHKSQGNPAILGIHLSETHVGLWVVHIKLKNHFGLLNHNISGTWEVFVMEHCLSVHTLVLSLLSIGIVF